MEKFKKNKIFILNLIVIAAMAASIVFIGGFKGTAICFVLFIAFIFINLSDYEVTFSIDEEGTIDFPLEPGVEFRTARDEDGYHDYYIERRENSGAEWKPVLKHRSKYTFILSSEKAAQVYINQELKRLSIESSKPKITKVINPDTGHSFISGWGFAGTPQELEKMFDELPEDEKEIIYARPTSPTK